MSGPRSRSLHPFPTVMLLAIAVLLLASCQQAPAGTRPVAPAPAQSGQQPSSTGSAAPSAEWDRLVAEAKKEGSVRVVVGPIPGLDTALAKAFEAEFGIRVDTSTDAGRQSQVRVQQESDAGKNTTDILISGGSELLTVYPAGLLEPIAPKLILPEVTNLANWADGKLKWVDAAQQYMLTTCEYVFADLMVNAAVVDPNSITSWKDLLKPEFRGRIVSHEPTDGPGPGTGRYLLEVFGPGFITALYGDQQPTYSRDPRQVIELMARGSHPIALAPTPPIAEEFKKQGFRLERVIPADGPGSIGGGWSVIKLVKNPPHPNAATVFVNWFATKRGQQLYSEIALEPSRRVDVVVPSMPDYFKLKPGVQYRDQYDEEYYSNVAPSLLKQLEQLLGR